jgi:putative aminopeptidase FrvX
MLAVAKALTQQPTAPFHEEKIRAEIERQLRICPHVDFARDDFGNVIAHYRRGPRRKARWAFAAHMDHPGWVHTKNALEEFQFLGSVPEAYLVNPKRKVFGDFAMWDLPAFETRDGKIFSRACDDLLGCAEVLCLFRRLESARVDAHCLGLFTRAEEVGFVGAIKLAQSEIVSKDVTILSLETSAPRGSAVLGDGPVVRVGDKLSTFDGEATALLLEVAKGAKIPVQRALLDGGACEATAYQLYGYRCAAASILLGNYHNCAPDGTIAAEYVSARDYFAMIGLCLAVVSSREKIHSPRRALRKKLEANARLYRALDVIVGQAFLPAAGTTTLEGRAPSRPSPCSGGGNAAPRRAGRGRPAAAPTSRARERQLSERSGIRQ